MFWLFKTTNPQQLFTILTSKLHCLPARHSCSLVFLRLSQQKNLYVLICGVLQHYHLFYTFFRKIRHRTTDFSPKEEMPALRRTSTRAPLSIFSARGKLSISRKSAEPCEREGSLDDKIPGIWGITGRFGG